MKKIAALFCLGSSLAGGLGAQEVPPAAAVSPAPAPSVAPGVAAASSSRSAQSDELQTWIFGAGAMVSATAGILLVSWDPGAHSH